MSEKGLAESGILGTSFNWWIGQIADDSSWRENVICAPFENKDENKGWARRYKVRILGIHDQGETKIPSDKLPWAQVMYPVTGGGFLSSSGQTPNLRQGNMVFGFFMDGQQMQVPIIMGILGNNAKNVMAATTGDNRVTNEQPGSLAVSGYAEGQKPKTTVNGQKETAPDQDLAISRPNLKPEAAPPPRGVKLNKYGLPNDPTPEQRADIEAKKSELEQRIVNGEFANNTESETAEIIDREIKQAVQNGIKRRSNIANSPATPASALPFNESPDVQQINASDVKNDDEMEMKTVMAKPDDPVQSAMKAIQTIIENMTAKVDKYLNAIQSYVDAVSSGADELQKFIRDAAQQMSKYMKVIYDKIMEFVLKQLNIVMQKVVAAMPTNIRHEMGDLKEVLNEKLLGVYNGMIGGLTDQLETALTDSIQPQKRAAEARANANSASGQFKTKPKTPVCVAESIASTMLSKDKGKITDANTNIVKSLNDYIGGKQDEINSVSAGLNAGADAIMGALGGLSSVGDFAATAGEVSGGITGGIGSIPDISSSLGSALSFANVVTNVFSGELKPKQALADFHQLGTGGSSGADFQTPSIGGLDFSVAESAQDRIDLIPNASPPEPFAQPAPDQAIASDLDEYTNVNEDGSYKPMTQEEKESFIMH